MTSRKQSFVLLVAVHCATIIGCRQGWEADYSKLGLVEIQGTVTMDGTPLTDATVIFEAEDRTTSFGKTDSAGKYQLMFDSEKSGVLPGDKVVRIKSSGNFGEEGASGESATKPRSNPIPPCYDSKSELRVTVKSSATMNFHLKKDCSVKGAE